MKYDENLDDFEVMLCGRLFIYESVLTMMNND